MTLLENKPRKPWIAGLLSLIQPGLGQIYNGEIQKAVPIYVLPVFLVPGLVLCLNSKFIVFFIVAYAIFGAAYYAFVFIDAIRTARRLSFEYTPKKYNTVAAYVGIYIVAAVTTVSLSSVIKNNFVQAYKFPSASMVPTLLAGDHVLVDRSTTAKDARKGDCIVFEFPEDPQKDFVKRVVAVGGDTVRVKDKELYVNDKRVTESYAVHKEPGTIPADVNPRDNFGPLVVPEGSYFVMGDNRDRSYDSRFWGAVSKDKVKGTVKTIYWSWDRENNAVRWSRIGMEVH